MNEATDGGARTPRVVVFALAAWTLIAVALAREVTGDWGFFVDRAHDMLGADGLLVYARHPDVQTGPLSLLAVAVLHAVGDWTLPIVIAALGVVIFAALARLLPPTGERTVTLLVGGAVLAGWWPYLKMSGHLDDALVLTLAAATVAAAKCERRGVAALLVGIAIAVKPWSLFLLPLTVVRRELGTRAMARPLISVLIAAVCWAPFFLSSTATLDGLHPAARVAPDSVFRVLGVADVPATLRTLQLLLGVLVAGVGVYRGRLGGVVLAGVAVRIALDPGTWNYYTVGLLVGALIWDLLESGWRVPWATIAVCLLMPPTWVAIAPDVRALARLAVCLCSVAIVLWPTRGRVRTGSRSRWYQPLLGPALP